MSLIVSPKDTTEEDAKKVKLRTSDQRFSRHTTDTPQRDKRVQMDRPRSWITRGLGLGLTGRAYKIALLSNMTSLTLS